MCNCIDIVLSFFTCSSVLNIIFKLNNIISTVKPRGYKCDWPAARKTSNVRSGKWLMELNEK